MTDTASPLLATDSIAAYAQPEPVVAHSEQPGHEPGAPKQSRQHQQQSARMGPAGPRIEQSKERQRNTGPARAVNPVLERLFALYPQMFGARFLPLKLGVYQELLAAHPEVFAKEELKLALGQHARSTRYLEAVASSSQRYNLQAEPVEPLAPDHVHHAIMEVFRRRQARSRDDLRPWLRERLAGAIEASGLGSMQYAEQVRSQDPVALQALQEAMEWLAEQSAKRAALLRAFDASGLGAAAFAQAYGLELCSVEQALAQRQAPSATGC